MSDATFDESLEAVAETTSAAIKAAWSSWGRLDSTVIAPLLNPAFVGGPAWPALRQAYAIARRDDALLVASSGLADPSEWDDEDPTNGYGLEVYGITSDLPADSGQMDVNRSWLGTLVRAVSNQAAHFGFQIPALLDEYGLLTIALPDVDLPDDADAYVDDNGMSVVMLGLTDCGLPVSVAGPLSPIRLVNVKLLTTAEGNFCVNNQIGDEQARRELARRFAEQGDLLWSSLNRPSVV